MTLIYEMDSTFHDVFKTCMREVDRLQTRHIMEHYCRVFFKNRAIPCQIGKRSFRLYLFSRRRPYVVEYEPFSLLEEPETVISVRRHDTLTGSWDFQTFLYRHDTGFGILRPCHRRRRRLVL
jgi:hypothetical protein